MNYSRLVFRVHAIQRMFERHFSEEDVGEAWRQQKLSRSIPTTNRIRADWSLGGWDRGRSTWL